MEGVGVDERREGGVGSIWGTGIAMGKRRSSPRQFHLCFC